MKRGCTDFKYNLNWKFFGLFLLVTAFSIYTLIFISSSSSLNQISQYYVSSSLRSFFSSSEKAIVDQKSDQDHSSSSSDDHDHTKGSSEHRSNDQKSDHDHSSSSSDDHDHADSPEEQMSSEHRRRTDHSKKSRIAVCLVGGARRFELTGPSIIDRILRQLPNSDLFLNSPMDAKAYKLSLLKDAPKIASVRIFKPVKIQEKIEKRSKVLSAAGSPNGIQGLLQYFNLVEGCLTLINSYEALHNFTYDWIVRTRVDTYWSSPIKPSSTFIPGHYIIPIGSSYDGLNDRFGIGDRTTSTIALSRLSLIPSLYSKGFRKLNSETAFKAQLTTHRIPFKTLDQPFCVVSDRTYAFPIGKLGVPVAAMSSPGPLNGAKCRPCKHACVGSCVASVMRQLMNKRRGWTEWRDGRLRLCDARKKWGEGWEDVFDQSVGIRLAMSRKRVDELKMKECVADFDKMRSKVVGVWDTPSVEFICKLGLGSKTSHIGRGG